MRNRNLSIRLFLFVCIGFLMLSCAKDKEEDPFLEMVRHENVSYGDHERQVMDVHLPQGRDQSTPVVVLIHGGFWVGGDKSDFSLVQQQLLNRGIASIKMNYRFVSPDNDYTGLMDDVGQALLTIKDKAREWGIRDRDFHLIGASAGGHMAMLYGYAFKKSNEVRSVASVAGPIGFTAEILGNAELIGPYKDPIEWLAGAPIPADENDPNYARYLLASPFHYVQAAVPTLFIHGTEDDIVPIGMSEELKAMLENNSITTKLVSLQGVGHDFGGSVTHMMIALNAVAGWITDLEK